MPFVDSVLKEGNQRKTNYVTSKMQVTFLQGSFCSTVSRLSPYFSVTFSAVSTVKSFDFHLSQEIVLKCNVDTAAAPMQLNGTNNI